MLTRQQQNYLDHVKAEIVKDPEGKDRLRQEFPEEKENTDASANTEEGRNHFHW